MTVIDVISQTQILDVTLPEQSITVDPISSLVTVVSTPDSPIAVTLAGPQGPPGSGSGYTHNQLSAETEWIINHNSGYMPTIQTFTVGGLEILGEVQHVSLNQTRVTFNTITAGSARLT